MGELSNLLLFREQAGLSRQASGAHSALARERGLTSCLSAQGRGQSKGWGQTSSQGGSLYQAQPCQQTHLWVHL